MRVSARIALASWVLLAGASALAGDGVLEVNQVCVATGCFSGDAAGFPVTIDGNAGHSVRLTSDLVVKNADTTAIQVVATSTADGVTIDLGGFTIRGPTSCSPPSPCAPTGVGYGVIAGEAALAHGVVVRNGSVVGMGASGVVLGPNGVAEDLRVAHNGGSGITSAGSGLRVQRCNASLNGGHGIAGEGGSVTQSESLSNGAAGIFCATCSIVGNTAGYNRTGGIIGLISTISGNTTYQNQGDGINCSFACTISGNTAYRNGDLTSPSGDGISCDTRCLVSGNTVLENADLGMRLGIESGYRENVLTGNATAPVLSGVNLGDNFCSGTGTVSATCP